MKIEESRSSFNVFVIGSAGSKLKEISDSLGQAGYMVAQFAELAAAFSEITSNPPHFVVFDFHESQFNLPQALHQVRSQLPETHLMIACEITDRPRATQLLERGVYDLLYLPMASQRELVSRFDHAAERDYLMYLNEQMLESDRAAHEAAEQALNQALPPVPVAEAPTVAEDFAHNFMRKLFKKKNADDCIDAYIESMAQALDEAPAVYFKYFANRRVLVAAMAYKLEIDWNGLGVDFNQQSTTFRTSQLRMPEELPEIRAMVTEVFSRENFVAITLESLGEIQGVAVFLCDSPSEEVRRSLQDCSLLLEKSLSLFEAERRLHSVSVKDHATNVLNRSYFLSRLTAEVARARRTLQALSIVVVAVDQFGLLVSEYGVEEGNALLRGMAKIIEKHSRVNDIVGRLGTDEFAVLLPHTAKNGALIKAERLRRIIESADFGKVVRALPSFTVSVGVSEYPSLSRDADELLNTADEALFQVRSVQNKVCVARAPEGFVADYTVNDKGL